MIKLFEIGIININKNKITAKIILYHKLFIDSSLLYIIETVSMPEMAWLH